MPIPNARASLSGQLFYVLSVVIAFHEVNTNSNTNRVILILKPSETIKLQLQVKPFCLSLLWITKKTLLMEYSQFSVHCMTESAVRQRIDFEPTIRNRETSTLLNFHVIMNNVIVNISF